MEQLVRPFQSTEVTAQTRVSVVADTKAVITPGHLCWGAVGALPKAIEQGEDFNGENFRLEECEEHVGETSRDTEDVRVEQPGKPDNYVIVQRVRKMNLNKTAKGKFNDTFYSETLNLQFPDFFAGTAFSANSEHNSCKQKMYFNR